jgi:hypothetical protein
MSSRHLYPAQPHLPEKLLPGWLLFNGTLSSDLLKEAKEQGGVDHSLYV